MNRIAVILCLCASAVLTACGAGPQETREFPSVAVPGVYTHESDILEYKLAHYWDAFLDTEQCYQCDSVTVNGVSEVSLSKAAVTYSQLLLSTGLENAQEALLGLLRGLEAFQTAYPGANVFEKVTELMASLEYDANSPLRDEDIYGPFAGAMSVSPFCPASRRASYADESVRCVLNRRGTQAADFEFYDVKGHSHTLYGTKAEWTVLNFINPGCNACEEVVSAFGTPAYTELIKEGRMCVLGIYIDEEMDKWFEESSHLPQSWLCGYDPCRAIRDEGIYDVRAIPSVYLLDRDKKVIMKDAPLDRVLGYIQTYVL